MPGMMVQFQHPGRAPSLEEAAARLDVPAAALDRGFGVIATDPQEHLYTVLIEAGAAERAMAAIGRGGAAHPAEGAFADVGIAPMGPPGSDAAKD